MSSNNFSKKNNSISGRFLLFKTIEAVYSLLIFFSLHFVYVIVCGFLSFTRG